MKSPRWSALAAFSFVAAWACATGARAQDLEIRLQLSKTTVLLGEPVWVDVSVTNRTKEALFVDFGVACGGWKPLTVQIPVAEPAIKEPRLCEGGIGISCSSGALPSLQPGEMLTRRYVLDGDFRIVHPGGYEVMIEKTMRYAPVAANSSDLTLTDALARHQVATLNVELEVQVADPEKLLALEQAAAQTAMARPAVTPRSGFLELEALLLRDVTAQGLSEYPAAGMEDVFRGWVEGHEFNTYGVSALKQLNTPASREALAEIAESKEHPDDTWFQSFRPQAVDALADLGDKTYVPLMERLLHDSSNSVQMSAAQALGLMGGEAELGPLADSARNGPTQGIRLEAIRAIGYTASLKAVPLLIDLVSMEDANQPDGSYYALRTLTHTEFPAPADKSIPEVKSAWMQFWSLRRQGARAYGPYDCEGLPTGGAK